MKTSKKKICFVVASPFTAQVFLKNHINELGKFYEIYLVANFDNFDKSIFLGLPIKEFKNVPIVRPININRDLKALFLLKKYFKNSNFDVVHTITPKAGLLGMFAARLVKSKVRIHIFTGQVWHTKVGVFKRILMLLDRFIVMCSTDILVDGESQRQFLIEKRILKRTNSFVLGKGSISGVNITRFVPDIDIKNKVRKELQIKTNEVVFMFLGRLNRDKGIVELTEAFNKLQLEYANVRLLLVGDDEENMVSVIRKGIKNIESVVFYGSTSSPEKILQACDVFCLPSYREGFGTSVIEASLLKKPVICSDTYGLMDTIIDNETGLRHKVADVDSLFFQMERLVKDNELRVTLGEKGRTYVLANFSAQLISKKWLEFYEKKI